MLHGSVRRVMVDAHDVAINMGRKQRLFTGKAREAAQLPAIRCGHRGCDVPVEFCDVDHIEEWSANHGATDQDNALPLCGVSDRWKHAQRLRGRRDKWGRVHLIRPDGTVIKPLGARDPVWADTESEPDNEVPQVPSVPGPDGPLTPTDQPEPDTFDAPVYTTTWGEFNENSTAPSRHSIAPDAIVQIIDLRAA